MKNNVILGLVCFSVVLLGETNASPIFRDSLPNGLIILTCEEPRLPIVDISFNCRSGAAQESPAKAGIASLCGEMLHRGTKSLSADSIATLLDFLGARLYTDVDFDHCSITLRLLAKDLDTGLDLLTTMVREPVFPETEFQRVREQMLTTARRSYDYPASRVTMEFDRILFADHRYSLPVRGDTATIPKITRSDLLDFYKNHFVPNNCFIVVVGDIDHETTKRKIEERLSQWQPAPIASPPPPTLYFPEKTRVKLITRPDMNQTYIHFGHPGISALDEDLIPTRLMSYILGGPPLSSRMGLSVREFGGLAYDVRCWFDRRLLPGAFRATVQTVKPNEAIKKMFAEIRKIHQSGVIAAELKKAQNYFVGSFPLTYSSNQGKLIQLTTLELYRFGLGWLEEFPQKVKTTTIQQVNQAARENLYPDRYIMVIMGNVTREELNLPDVEWLE